MWVNIFCDLYKRVKSLENDIQWLIDEHDRHNNYIHSLEVQLDNLLERETRNEIYNIWEDLIYENQT